MLVLSKDNEIRRLIIMMVAVDEKDDDTEVYVSIEIDSDKLGFIPENTPTDIIKTVMYCNEHIKVDSLHFVDMFGITKNGYTELWEEIT